MSYPRCIFCLQFREPSVEHIFPYAIGGGLTTEQVCQECYSWLGHNVDSRLSDHLLIQLARFRLRIAGQSGAVPDPFFSLLRGGVLASDPTRKVFAKFDPVTKRPRVKVGHSKPVEMKREDGTVTIRFSYDANLGLAEGMRLIKREMKRRKLPELALAELEEVARKGMQPIETIEQPSVLTSMDNDDTGLRLAILKIAFELACSWLGEAYLDDTMAHKLRDVIMGRADLRTTELQYHIQPGNDLPGLDFWKDDTTSHIAHMHPAIGPQSGAVIVLRIFDAFSALIVVSETTTAYGDIFDEDAYPFLLLDPVSRTVKKSSLAAAVSKVCAERQLKVL